MKSALYYFYGINVNKIYETSDGYYFFYSDYKYYFLRYETKENLKYLYDISNKLYNENVMVHTFILTKDNDFVVFVDDITYVLLRVNSIEKDEMTIEEMINFSFSLNKIQNFIAPINLTPWNIIWAKKIDSIEKEIDNTIDEFPLIKESIDYYIGLGENAISYVKDSLDMTIEEPTMGICHKRIKHNILSSYIYNPLNFSIDYVLRDLSEYLKTTFFTGKLNWDYVETIFINNKFKEIDIKLFYARMIYPSYYFDVVENAFNGKEDENLIKSITIKSKEYENFLFDLYILLKKDYNIRCLDWIFNNAKK